LALPKSVESGNLSLNKVGNLWMSGETLRRRNTAAFRRSAMKFVITTGSSNREKTTSCVLLLLVLLFPLAPSKRNPIQGSLFQREEHMTRGVECPAIAELKKALNSVFPSVETGTIRLPDPADRHTSGVAMDVMLDIREPEEKALADGIISVLQKHHALMQWSDIIYSDWNPDGSIYYYHIPGGGHGYGGVSLARNNYTSDTEHTNHFHIDWVDFSLKNPPPEFFKDPYIWSGAAKTTGFSSAITPDLEAIKRGERLPGPPAAATPTWLWGWWKITEDDDVYYYYFGLAGFVAWTDARPTNSGVPIVSPQK
jgi:hypothetical protein